MFENVKNPDGTESENEFYLTYRVTGQKIKWKRSDETPIGVFLDTLKRPETTDLVNSLMNRQRSGDELTSAEIKELERYNQKSNEFFQKLIRSIVSCCDPECIPEPAKDKLDLITFSMSSQDVVRIQNFFLSR